MGSKALSGLPKKRFVNRETESQAKTSPLEPAPDRLHLGRELALSRVARQWGWGARQEEREASDPSPSRAATMDQSDC